MNTFAQVFLNDVLTYLHHTTPVQAHLSHSSFSHPRPPTFPGGEVRVGAKWRGVNSTTYRAKR